MLSMVNGEDLLEVLRENVMMVWVSVFSCFLVLAHRVSCFTVLKQEVKVI